MYYLSIDKTSSIPLYRQIQSSIRKAILNGDLKNQAELPTEEVVCFLLRISRQVIRKAYKELIEEGLIRREKGGSPFVFRTIKFEIPLNSIPFTTSHTYSWFLPKMDILVFEKLDRAEDLTLNHFSSMYRATCVYSLDGIPLFKQEIFLNTDFFSDLKVEILLLNDLLKVIQDLFKVKIEKVNNYAFQANLNDYDSRLLNLSHEAPSMHVESIVQDVNGHKIAVVNSVYPGEYFEFIHEVNHDI